MYATASQAVFYDGERRMGGTSLNLVFHGRTLGNRALPRAQTDALTDGECY